MPTSRKRRGKMPALDKFDPFDVFTNTIASRYHLGPKGRSLVRETLDLITGHPGGLGGFLARFKAAGLGAEVASWIEADPLPLPEEKAGQVLGSEVIARLAMKAGVSQGFAKTVLGKTIPGIIGLLIESGFSAETVAPAVPLDEQMVRREPEKAPPVIAAERSSAKRSFLLPPGRWLAPGAALVVALGAAGYFFVPSRGIGHHTAPGSGPVIAKVAPAAAPPSQPAPSGSQSASDVAANSSTLISPAPPPNLVAAAAPPNVPASNDAVQAAPASPAAAPELGAGVAANAPAVIAQAPSQKQNVDAAAANAPIAGNATPPEMAAAGNAASQTAAASPAAAPEPGGNEPAADASEASIKLPAIYFAANSVKVSSASKASLEQVAGLIKQLPRGSVVSIDGYPSKTGNPASNIKLSRKRANAVRQALVEEGVSPAMLIAKGYANSHTISDMENTESRGSVAKKGQPRVEFRIVQQ